MLNQEPQLNVPFSMPSRQRWFNSHRPNALRQLLSDPVFQEAMLLLTEESIPVVGDVVRRDAYDVSARLGAISGRMSVFRDLVSLTVPPKNVANLSAEPGSIYPDEDSPWKHIVPDKLRREQSINVVIPHE